jgi:hypothetical protein
MEDSDDFWELGVCDFCDCMDWIGCWDGEWMCEDCFLETLNIEE